MSYKYNKIIQKFILVIFITFSLAGCSQNQQPQALGSSAGASQVIDPLEKVNRKIYAFNVGLDDYLLKPLAKGYKKVTPEFVDTSISNFFSNLGDVGNAFNNLLQFKFLDAFNDTERVLINSTLGFGGFLDIASAAGIKKNDEDFGQTLAKWGVGSGPYVMLPFLGPSTVRDAGATFTVDRLTDPTNYTDESLYYFALDKLDARADLLDDEAAFEKLSEDQYAALRDAWLQRREYLITDGKSAEKAETDLIDELEDLDDL